MRSLFRFVREQLKFIVIFVFLALAMSYVCFTESGLYKLYRLQQEKTRLEEEIQNLREGNACMAEQTDLLKNDRETVERAIREKLRMVLPDDTIFLFRSAASQTAGNSVNR
jgi:cell division protein FtsB